MSFLEKLPQELLIDNLFPFLSLKDALNLFQTNKFFAQLGRDEVLWKRRLLEDFNFTSASNARSSGFKFLYSRLRSPKVFVWGGTGQGRIGRPIPHEARKAAAGKQLWPLELKVPGARIVELAAGGWSFTALDSQGGVHVWGQLEGSYGLLNDGFAKPSRQASKPLKLDLPVAIRSLSCGRDFMVALDNTKNVWCFNSWGLPFVYHPKAFDRSLPGNAIVQVECGWSFSAALTESGNAYVWNQLNGRMGGLISAKQTALEGELAGSEGRDRVAPEVDGVIKCHTWDFDAQEPLLLPPLPELPIDAGASQPHLVKIAAGDHFVIGLTNLGHVLKLDISDINDDDALSTLAELFKRRDRGWEYLPLFCDGDRVKKLGAFQKGDLQPPEQLNVTHISAHFLTFVAYSTGKDSIVLMGRNETRPADAPAIQPNLQNKGVISIVLGDYHYGALLENGRLLTWGAVTATGLGDPFKIEPGQPGGFRTQQDRNRGLDVYQDIPDVPTPTEVRFDHGLKKPRQRFVFAAAAAGWHMGALVVDLDEEEEEEEVEEEEREDDFYRSPPAGHQFEGGIPLGGPILSPFIVRGLPFRGRIGLAGARGRGRGANDNPNLFDPEI
ncbi:hypothetical protein FRC17_005425 [Serendipita sp. 399]|nr:hypothetical protein FRC17_005425 [Serendipita sp. 399]